MSLSPDTLALLTDFTSKLAEALDVIGLINVQFAVKQVAGRRFGPAAAQVFVIEANPRASRTVPFVAKARGVPLVKIAARVMVGATIAELRTEGLLKEWAVGDHIAVKEAVLPFSRFPEADAMLGPEMRSTGEVMGIDLTPGLAFAKAQAAAGGPIPAQGTLFLSLAPRDKALGVQVGVRFAELGYDVLATSGTAAALRDAGVEVRQVVAKLDDPDGPHAVDLIGRGEIDLVVNTPRGRGPRADGAYIRRAAAERGVPLLTTVSAALAAAEGVADEARHKLMVRTVQEYHRGVTSDQLVLEI